MVGRRHGAINATATSSSYTQRAHRPDYQILLYVGLLMLLGLILMYAIGPQRAMSMNLNFGTNYTGTYFLVRQAINVAVAVAAIVCFAILPLKLVRQYAGWTVIAGIAASLFLLFFGNFLHIESITTSTRGACRWIEIGPIGFQPAELMKFGILIYVARLLADAIKQGNLNDWKETLVPVLVTVGLAALFIVVLQKDLGTGISMIAIVATMLMAANINKKIGFQLIVGLLAIGVLMIIMAPHRVERVLTFFSGDTSGNSIDSSGYHVEQAKIAIGSGGMFGVGIGNSVQATGYLPEVINDSVFAIIGETFGFVGLMVLLVLFTGLLTRLLKIADRLSDVWMRLVVVGVFGWIASHTILNIASMTGVFPLTGITLPLLSFGGTSIAFIAAAIGIVFQASRYTTHGIIREDKEASGENSQRRRRVGRPRYTSYRRSR